MNEPYEYLHQTVARLVPEGRLSGSVWRQFLCDCSRSVMSVTEYTNKALVIELAEERASRLHPSSELGRLAAELRSIEDLKWEVLLKLRGDPIGDWPVSEEVDCAWVEYYSALSLRIIAGEDLQIGEPPSPQASLFGWAKYRERPIAARLPGGLTIDARNDLILKASSMEERRQVALFRIRMKRMSIDVGSVSG